MATSDVKIVNLALQKLGADRIESLTEDSPNARSMNACYEAMRDAELRRYDWSFAIARKSVAKDPSGPVWGGWNRYSLPNDFLRLIRDDESGSFVDWKIEGIYILSKDAAPLQFRYIARISDPNFFDSLFVDAFACRLALQTCEEITGSTAKKQGVKEDYDDAIAEARRLGAIEKAALEAPEDPWLAARR